MQFLLYQRNTIRLCQQYTISVAELFSVDRCSETKHNIYSSHWKIRMQSANSIAVDNRVNDCKLSTIDDGILTPIFRRLFRTFSITAYQVFYFETMRFQVPVLNNYMAGSGSAKIK